MLEVVQAINGRDILRHALVLKGGTALHCSLFQLKRLSVDVDLDFVGRVEKEEMEFERPGIREAIIAVLEGLDYRNVECQTSYAEDRYEAKYLNSKGSKDHIKVEVNYLNRMPLLPTASKKLKHPFEELDFHAMLYAPEELCAGKIRALMMRGTARDLYDTGLIAQEKSLDIKRLRKASLFYLSVSDYDVRDASLSVLERIDEKELRGSLVPMLRTKGADLLSMRDDVLGFIEALLDLEDEECRYFDQLYDAAEFEPDLLFDGLIESKDLVRHPLVVLKLRKIKSGRF